MDQKVKVTNDKNIKVSTSAIKDPLFKGELLFEDKLCKCATKT